MASNWIMKPQFSGVNIPQKYLSNHHLVTAEAAAPDQSPRKALAVVYADLETYQVKRVGIRWEVGTPQKW